MDTLLNKIKKLTKQVRGFFPEPLPVGKAEFEAWVDSFIATYQMPTQDKDSIIFSLGTMIMHLNSTAAYRSKFYFLLCLRAAAAKQIAGAAFYEIKHKQQEAQKAAQAKSVEVTTQVVVAPSEPQK